MTNFKKLYRESRTAPSSAPFNGKTVWAADKFPVSNKEKLIIQVEKTNSKYKQGFCLGVEGSVKFMGQQYRKGKKVNFFLWEREESYEVQVFTKTPYIYIKNAWYDTTLGDHAPACYITGTEWLKYDYWGGAGMIIEEIENGRRYYCNDGECDDDFDDIIFTVKRKIEFDDLKK